MWSTDRDMEEQHYLANEHHLLTNHHISIKPRGENGIGGMDHNNASRQHLAVGGGSNGGGSISMHASLDQLESGHLLEHHVHHGHHDIMDPMAHHLSEQETLMLGTSLNGDHHGHSVHSGHQAGGSNNSQDDLKLPSRKEKQSILRLYAKKLGLNERGCYLAVILAFFILFLMLIILAMAITWPVSQLRYSGPLEICKSAECLRAAANIADVANFSSSPCSNIYSYSCDGWSASRVIPAGRSSISTLKEMEYHANKEKSRIVSMFSHKPSQYDSIEWKVQHFYESCKSLDYIESDREKPLMKIVNNLGGWDVLRTFNRYNWDSYRLTNIFKIKWTAHQYTADYRRVLRELHSDFLVDVFFKVDVQPDYTTPGQNIIRISPAGLGLPDKSYYHRLPEDPAVQAYQTFMKDSAQLFGAPSPEAHKFAVDIFNFEKRIAEITPDMVYMSDPLKVNNKVSLKDLRIMSINIPWLEVLKACYPNSKITENTSVMLVSPQYVADIAVIMSTTDRASLNNYLIWQLVRTYMPYLSSSYTEVVNMYTKFRIGADKPLERWQFCFQVTNDFFGHLLDSLYSEEKELKDEREVVIQRVFSRLRDSVGHKVSVSTQFDYFTRQTAIDKLHAMSIQIGTPNILKDRKFLKIMYKDLSVQNEDFFQNILYGKGFLRRRQEHTLMSPGEETRWLPNLLEDRVTYSPAANKVIIPEYMLSEPLFHPNYPTNVLLGGIGSMIAEAIVDGVAGVGAVFTATGRILDGSEAGNFTLSRAEKPNAALEGASKCIARSWANHGIDTAEQLEKTAVSNAISVAGLQAAYTALTEAFQVENAQLLPSMGDLDPQAVFFLQYSQLQCSLSTQEQADLDRTLQPWLPGKTKLAGMLEAIPDFKHYFFCSDSDMRDCENTFF